MYLSTNTVLDYIKGLLLILLVVIMVLWLTKKCLCFLEMYTAVFKGEMS